jgi:hypothetical protein
MFPKVEECISRVAKANAREDEQVAPPFIS